MRAITLGANTGERSGEAELFHTPTNEAYATIPVNGHYETWPVKDAQLQLWLRHKYYKETGAAPSSRFLNETLANIEAEALFDGSERTVFCRLVENDGVIYLDLGNEHWEAVAIGPDEWKIVSNPPVKFHRPRGMAALPYPQPGGDLTKLRQFLNITRDIDWILIVSWLLSSLRPTGPYTILALHGEQGSSKTTASRMLRSLIDPNESPVRAAPRNERDLMIATSNAWCLAFDNLSGLSPWLSDALCRVATGGGYGTRALYTNRDELLINGQRPIMLNGIDDLMTRGDLLDRAIVIELPHIPAHKRQDEQQLWTAFEAARPYILGALLDTTRYALRHLDTVKLETLPRMADFARWSCAAAPACGWSISTDHGVATGAEAFLHAYGTNQQSANELALESDIAQAIRELIDRAGTWRGTHGQLLDILNATAGKTSARSHDWPRSPRKLSDILKRLTPNLRAIGIHLSRPARESGQRPIIISRVEPA